MNVFAINQFSLRSFDRVAQISCQSAAELNLFIDVFGALQCSNEASAELNYTVELTGEPAVFRITRPGRPPLLAGDTGELLYLLEKDWTIEFQRLRHDLYFIHGAALELNGNAMLLVAPSGQGKSTTTWGLLHHGFGYLSDELAPTDLETMQVQPYPHALCLKKEPPSAYPLPPQVARTRRTLHVPASALPGAAVKQPVPIRTLIFLEYCPNEESAPELVPISKGEAAARLYTQALNPLAHEDDGLRGALAISRAAGCYALRSADLRLTCELMTSTFLRSRLIERKFPQVSGQNAQSTHFVLQSNLRRSG